MKNVSFPGLNLYLNINNVAFSIGERKIYWYGILIISSIILAIIFFYRDDGKYKIKFENILILLLFMIPIVFIGARIYFVIFRFSYYLANPTEILNIQNGGLAIYGGIISGVITIIIFCKIKKINIFDMLDYITLYLPLGQAIGRWGNFFNIEAYGSISTGILRMGIIEKGIYKEVHPTFLYESLATFCIFIILMLIKNRRKYSGQITHTYLILYSFCRFFIEGLRTDSLMIGNIRVSQILSLIVFIVSLFVVLKKIYNKKEKIDE